MSTSSTAGLRRADTANGWSAAGRNAVPSASLGHIPKMLASTLDRLLHHDTNASLKATRCGSASHLGQRDAPDLTPGANLMDHRGALVTTRADPRPSRRQITQWPLTALLGASLAAHRPPTTVTGPTPLRPRDNKDTRRKHVIVDEGVIVSTSYRSPQFSTLVRPSRRHAFWSGCTSRSTSRQSCGRSVGHEPLGLLLRRFAGVEHSWCLGLR
jgi:hypothetical protein